MKRVTVAGASRRKRKIKQELEGLYEADETAWLERMVELIQTKRYGELDYENLCEFLESMAKRDRREVLSRLVVLLTHLLKWEHQARKRSRSWSASILQQRYELQDDLESKTLRNHAEAVLAKAYERAVRAASNETGLASNRFPTTCPYNLDQLLSGEGRKE